MADIFISYARADRERIEKLAAALESEGYSVWWDQRIQSGSEFSKVIEAEIVAAKAVIVCWSQHANESRWVKDEASSAAEANKLIPVSIDGVHAPIGFRQFHCADLSRWHGKKNEAAFQDFKGAVRARVTSEASPAVARTAKAAGTSKLNFTDPKIFAGLSLALFAAAVVAFLLRTVPEPATQHAPVSAAVSTQSDQTPSIKSVAVLPFADMSESQDQGFFSDGVAEEILNTLASLDDLRVAGRTSSFSFRGDDVAPGVIGETLRVAHLLEGSVRTDGDRVRITAKLIKVEDGFEIWSQTFDRPSGDIFAVQDEIARAVAGELEILLSDKRQFAAPITDDKDAYRLYLEGRALMRKRIGDNLPRAMALFEQALVRDPDFAHAVAGLAVATELSIEYTPAVDIEAAARKSVALAKQSIALNPDLAEPYSVLGMNHIKRREFIAARREFDKALLRRTTEANVLYWAAWSRTWTGNASDAVALHTEAIETDPISPTWFVGAAIAELQRSNIETAAAYAQRAVDLGNPSGNYVLARIASARGDHEQSAKLLVESFASGGAVTTFTDDKVDILARAITGNTEATVQAKEILNAYFADADREVDLFPMLISILINDPADFLVLVERHRTRSDQYILFEFWWPTGRHIRQHTAFQGFANRNGLVDYWNEFGWPDLCRPTGPQDSDFTAFECD